MSAPQRQRLFRQSPQYCVCAILLVTLLIQAACLQAQSVRTSSTDLWDIKQGAIVTAHSGTLPGFPINDMFGGMEGPEGWGHTLFADRNPAGFVCFVEWRTARPVRLTGFSLFANHDAPPFDANERGFSRFTLYAMNLRTETFEQVYSFTPENPYQYQGPNSLLLATSVTPIEAQHFRAEFVQFGDRTRTASGPRIVELDGYGTVLGNTGGAGPDASERMDRAKWIITGTITSILLILGAFTWLVQHRRTTGHRLPGTGIR